MKKILITLIRNSKGQALPLVLCFLALGALVITPLLNYVYTGLSTGQIYWEKVPLSYAAEAGLEDGIWRTDKEDMEEEPYNLEPYDYTTVYNYSLPEQINDKEVSVDIKQVWPLAGLEDDTYGTTSASDFVVTGGVINADGGFQVRLAYDYPETELFIRRIGVWLPPDFAYVYGSSDGITTHDDVPDNPVETPWNGGTVLEWDLSSPVNFVDLPEPGAGEPVGGLEPGAERPSLRILEFEVTPHGEIAMGSYSWAGTTDITRYLSWERNIAIYRIESTATDNTTGESASAAGYTYVSKGVDTGWIDTGGSLFTGNYRAIGNSLMLDLYSDPDNIRDTLITDDAGSSSTISNIPSDAGVAFAYLYWSGWYNNETSDADTTCTFMIDQAEIINPNASGNYTECDTYGDYPNYLCADDLVADDDSTYVHTGDEFNVLRPDAAGTYTQCTPVGAPSNYQCVDETSADNDSTYVQTGGGGVEILRPNGSGYYTQCDSEPYYSWNYQCVDDVTSDGDFTYIYTQQGATERDTYSMQNHSEGSGTINSVTVHVLSRADSSADMAVETMIRTYNNNYYGDYTVLPAYGGWQDVSKTYTTNPYTSSAWTWTEVDALQAGVRQYDLGSGWVRTTQVYIEVDYWQPTIETLRPSGSGYYTQCDSEPYYSWNYQCVDDVTSDGDFTYIYTQQGATERDTYSMQNHSQGSGTINSVTVHVLSRADSSSSMAVETMIRTYNNSYYGDYTVLPAYGGWQDVSKTYTTNPFTSSAWTWTEVDALEAGVRQYDLGYGSPRTTQVYIEVDYGQTEEEQMDTYSIDDHTVSGTPINSVTVYVISKGTSSPNTHAAETVIRTYGNDYFGTYTLLPISYTELSTTYTTNPYTSSAWTWDEIDAIEAGVKHYDNGSGGVRTTQVYIDVDYGPDEQMDTYNLADHDIGVGTINSITVYVISKGTSSPNTNAAETVIRTHGNDYFGTYTLLPTSYTELSTTYTTNPYTSSAWTWDEIDALEAGVKHYDNGGGGVRTTQVYIYIDYGSHYEGEVTADTWWTVDNAWGHSYSCFKDVTGIVDSVCPGCNAIYSVAHVDGHEDNYISYAGWSLIIIYASPSEDGHHFFLWNVLLHAPGNCEGTFVIEGFVAPADAEAAITCFNCEGDGIYTGDYLQFNGENLYDAVNPENNIWNCKSSGLAGELIDGVDIDTFDVSSPIIGEGDTSAEVTFVTATDAWNLIYLFLSFRSDVAVLIPSGTGIYSYGF